MAKTHFGIVGCGSAALSVCEALAASTVAGLAQVHDRDPALAQDLGQRYGVPVAARLEDLLDNPSVDAVYVAVPHHLLAPLARRALEAGKPVLVEKPMAIILAEADDLIALAEARRLALGVFYELRHNSALTQARDLVRAGAIGDILGVRIKTLIDKPLHYWQSGYTGRSQSAWRGQRSQAGGGVVLMNSSHLLDAVWYVTGLAVTRVSAEAGTLVAPVEVEDTAAAVMRYHTGAIGTLMAGAHIAGARSGDERFDVFGREGQLMLPDPYGQDPLRVFLRREWNGLPANMWAAVPSTPAAIFVRAIEDFAHAVQRGEAAPTSGHDARRVLATVLAVYQSAAEGRVIPLK